MSDEQSVLDVQVANRICVLILNRPERRNALSRAMNDALRTALLKADVDPAVSVIAITGAGSTFCAGADLKDARSKDDAGQAYRGPLHQPERTVFEVMLDARKPIVGIVNGPATAGGCELALACDLRVGGPRTRFSLPETAIGLLPTAGGTTRLARLVGVSRAKEMILGGRVLDPETALAWGLLHRVVDDPRAEAAAWAVELSGRDATALRKAKARLDADESDGALLGERVSEAGLYERRRR